MNTTNRVQKPLDMALIWENQPKFDRGLLRPYIRKVIAWDGDGASVLFSADSNVELLELLKRGEGFDSSQVLIDYLPYIG